MQTIFCSINKSNCQSSLHHQQRQNLYIAVFRSIQHLYLFPTYTIFKFSYCLEFVLHKQIYITYYIKNVTVLTVRILKVRKKLYKMDYKCVI